MIVGDKETGVKWSFLCLTDDDCLDVGLLLVIIVSLQLFV